MDGQCLTTDTSQINSRAINIVTSMEAKEKVQRGIDNFVEHQIGELNETNKNIIENFGESIVQPQRDYQLPTMIGMKIL